MEPTELQSDGVTPRENLEGDGDDSPLDLLLMPGLAFDAAGNRLGRGGGFYDAFIERYESRCLVGLFKLNAVDTHSLKPPCFNP